MMRVLVGFIVTIFISTMLVSCGGGGSEDDLTVVVKIPKTVKKVVEEKVEAPRQTNPEQLSRKPFKSYLAVHVECSDGVVSEMCPEEVAPLQRFPLHSFKMNTILVFGGKPRGVVTDSDSNKHSVFIGTKIGNRGGVIVDIGHGRIVVEEPSRWNDDGSVAATDRVEIALPGDKR